VSTVKTTEGPHMPSLGKATEWLNSQPLGPGELRGRVVVGGLLDADVHQLAANGWLMQEITTRLPGRTWED
jgi:hypothetical protein